MKKILLILFIVQFSFILFAQEKEEYVEKEYFLKLNHHVVELFGKPIEPYTEYKDFIQNGLNDNVILNIRFPFINLKGELSQICVITTTVELTEEDLNEINSYNAVDYIEKVPKYNLFSTPNDLNKKQWGLKNIDAEEAWDFSTGGNKVIVAVIDDAIAINHEDLKSNIWKNTKEIPGNKIDDDANGYVDDVYGWDVADSDNDPTPPSTKLNSMSHGTHVSGIVGAKLQDLRHLQPNNHRFGFGANRLAMHLPPDIDPNHALNSEYRYPFDNALQLLFFQSPERIAIEMKKFPLLWIAIQLPFRLWQAYKHAFLPFSMLKMPEASDL